MEEGIILDKSLIQNPYNYICNYYESILPFIGKKAFSILSLVPPSLIMPKIPRGKKQIKQKIVILLLAQPGAGKSSLADEFSKIAYFPVVTKSMTPARIDFELNKRENKRTTLIVEDVATMFADDVLIKILEGALGEEESILRDTMRNIEKEGEKINKKREVVAYLSGTPSNIADRRIRDGLLMRTSPLLVFYTPKEHEKIIDFIADSMGKEETNSSPTQIKSFYDKLYKIQEGTDKDFAPIEGYIFSENINNEVKSFIKPLVKSIFDRWAIPGFRETEEFFRFLCSHAFLNIFNRKIEDRKIVITQQDLNIAKILIKREIYTKYVILKAIENIDYYNIRTMNELRDWESKINKIYGKEIPKETKFVMSGLVNN